jgi:hypothetical protein
MKKFSFKSVKKDPWPIAFDDGTNITLIPASLKTIKQMQSFTDDADMDDLIDLTAEILSVNLEGVEITKDYVEENMSYTQLLSFFEAYSEYIQQNIKSQKN